MMLQDKVALVTGTSPNIGGGIAEGLAEAGAAIVAVDARAENAVDCARYVNISGGRASGITADATNEAQVKAAVAGAVEAFGRVDILVNNAVAPHGADRDWTWKIPEEAWDKVFRVNTKGPFLMSSAVIRHLLEHKSQGRIINITSMAGRQGSAQRAAYSASKFALTGLTQSMALELAPYGITVNAVSPGPMETARGASRAARAADSTDGEFVAPPPTTPVGRIGVPDDIARAVVFLAEPAASFITGETINISGGELMF